MAKKKIGANEYSSSAFLVVGDAEKPSTWHLRVKDSDGAVNHRLLGAAWAALHGGYRGNKYEGEDKDSALKKLKALYKSEGLETPTESTKAADSLDDIINLVRQEFYEEFCMPNGAPSPWIQEVFTDYVIVNYDGKMYSVGYEIMDGDEVEFDEITKWTEVEKEYTPVKSESMMVGMGTEVKATDDGHLTGYLVRFGTPTQTDESDSRDFFTAETDFGFKGELKTPVWFHHCIPIKAKGKNAVIRVLDMVGEGMLSIDEKGVLIDAILTNTKYSSVLKSNVKALGWSSGTAPHLVRRVEQDNGSHWVKQWRLGLDASLTPHPAEPRNQAVLSSVKMGVAQEIDFDVEQFSKQSAANPSTKGAGTAGGESLSFKVGDTEMDEKQLQAMIADGIKSAFKAKDDAELAVKAAQDAKAKEEEDFQKKVDAAVGNAIKAAGGRVLRLPAVKTEGNGGPAVTKTPLGDDAFKALNWFIKTGDPSGIRTGEAYEELKTTYSLLESTQYQGQEAVPTEVVAKIVERRDPLSIIRAAGAEVMPVGTNAVVIPIEKNSPEKFVITTIDGTNTFDQTTQQPIDKAAVTIYMFTKSVPIDIQLLDDAVFDVEAWWSRRIARAMAITENYYFTIGSGSGQPQGLLTGATKGVDAAAATAIAAGEVVSLYHTLTSEYRDAVSWFMNGSVEGLIRKLNGTPFYFVGNGGNNGGAGNAGFPQGAGSLVGPSRVFNAADMTSTIAASSKPLLVANVNAAYSITERKGLTILRDPYTLANKGQINVLTFFRNSGAVVNPVAAQYILQPSA